MRPPLLLAIVVAATVAACGLRATPPPDSAPPAVVLRSYLSALLIGDCEAAHALATSTFFVGNGELCGSVHVSAVGPLTDPALPSDHEAVFATTLTTDGDGGVSVTPGDITWFYALERQPNGTWRLTGGGTGP
jgi:hypothetical protein